MIKRNEFKFEDGQLFKRRNCSNGNFNNIIVGNNENTARGSYAVESPVSEEKFGKALNQRLVALSLHQKITDDFGNNHSSYKIDEYSTDKVNTLASDFILLVNLLLKNGIESLQFPKTDFGKTARTEDFGCARQPYYSASLTAATISKMVLDEYKQMLGEVETTYDLGTKVAAALDAIEKVQSESVNSAFMKGLSMVVVMTLFLLGITFFYANKIKAS